MKHIIILTVLFCYNSILGQIPPSAIVSAPALESIAAKDALNSVKTLGEAAQQTSQLKQTYDLVKENAELLSKVNNLISKSIQSYNVLEKISETGINISKLYGLMQKAEEKGKSEKMIKGYLKTISSFNENSNQLNKDLTNVISNNVLKMNDFERITLLDRLEEKATVLKVKTDSLIEFLEYTINL